MRVGALGFFEGGADDSRIGPFVRVEINIKEQKKKFFLRVLRASVVKFSYSLYGRPRPRKLWKKRFATGGLTAKPNDSVRFGICSGLRRAA